MINSPKKSALKVRGVNIRMYLVSISLASLLSCSTEPNTEYTLKTNISPVEGGKISPSEGKFEEGEQVQINALANDNWIFVGWEGDNTGTENPMTIVMDSDKYISAKFKGTFYLDQNNVTVKCYGVDIGGKEILNGQQYEAVDRSLLELRMRQGVELNNLCTSNVKDMSFLFSVQQDPDKSIDTGNEMNVSVGKLLLNEDITNWDVSSVEDMNHMFANNSEFNQDIGAWDVSSVGDMNNMFFNATSFNQDIGAWDVSSVKYMNHMFFNASSFNQDIGNWNVKNVTDMYAMFGGATYFNQNIGAWNVANVTSMGWMFRFAKSFDQDISNWDVSNVVSMVSMFKESPFNQDIGNWNVGNVEFMQAMFAQNTRFNQNLNNWDVSNVSNMRWMFNDAKSFDQDISSWNITNVTDTGWMFAGAESFNQDIRGWKVSSVIDMEGMFHNTPSFNQNLTGWCVANFTYEPFEFATESALLQENKPIWGTCPE